MLFLSDYQLDMPHFMYLFSSSSQLLYEHFTLISPDPPHASPLLSFLQALIIFKHLLCPIKRMTFSWPHTFFNTSNSSYPSCKCTYTKSCTCHHTLIPSALPFLCLELLCLLTAADLLSSAYVQSCSGHQHLPAYGNF